MIQAQHISVIFQSRTSAQITLNQMAPVAQSHAQIKPAIGMLLVERRVPDRAPCHTQPSGLRQPQFAGHAVSILLLHGVLCWTAPSPKSFFWQVFGLAMCQ